MNPFAIGPFVSLTGVLTRILLATFIFGTPLVSGYLQAVSLNCTHIRGLLNAGTPESEIIERIRKQGTDCSLTATDLEALRGAKASEQLLAEIKRVKNDGPLGNVDSPAPQSASVAGVELKIKGTPPYSRLTRCVADYFQSGPLVFRVRRPDIPAETIMGRTGDGFGSNSSTFMEDFATFKLDAMGRFQEGSRGNMTLWVGEPVELKGADDFFYSGEHLNEVTTGSFGDPVNLLHVHIRSILRHNVTRGRGAFQHQSPETLSTHISVPLSMPCEVFKTAWEDMFVRISYDEVNQILEMYPSGVLVLEISEGMSPAEVEGIMGSPERRARFGERLIYFYPDMKITFESNKVWSSSGATKR